MKNIILLLIISFSKYHFEETIFVFEHFRHGARGPISYMSDNLTDSLKIYWGSIGEINKIGMKQHFLSGYQKLKKYKNLLEDPFKVFCYTTNLNRTKISLKYHLLGIYNYSNILNISDYNKYYFIPKNISTFKNLNFNFDKTYDILKYSNVNENIKIKIFDSNKIKYRSKICPYLKQIRKNNNLKAKNLYENIIKNFNDKYLNKLKNYLNNNSFYFFSFKYLTRICDTYISDYIYDQQIFHDKLKNLNFFELYEDCINIMNISMYNTYYVNDYNVVPIANNFIKIFYKYLKLAKKKNSINDNDYIKYVMFSGHDSSVASIIMFFKFIFNNEINVKPFYPFFGTSLIIELNKKENDNNEYYIKCIVDDELFFEMNYNKFIKRFESYLMNDDEINNYCYNINNNILLNNRYLIVIIIFIILFFAIFICVLRCKKNNIKNNNDNNKNSQELEDKFI